MPALQHAATLDQSGPANAASIRALTLRSWRHLPSSRLCAAPVCAALFSSLRRLIPESHVLSIYRDEDGRVRTAESLELPDAVIWIDLLSPTDEELAFVSSRVGIKVPTREALSEIEASSRLIIEGSTLYLSTPVVAQSDGRDAHLSPAGFVLSATRLVTVRYDTLSSFDEVSRQVREDPALATGVGVFVALLEAMVDRGADVLERLREEVDKTSRSVFRGDQSNPRHLVRSTARLRETLGAIGAIGDRVSMARDALLGIGRIASFAGDVGQDWFPPAFKARLGAVQRDIVSLNDYEAHLAGKVQFLLDAVLGFITIQQNDLFKLLTIASVVGIPPTIAVGIWGMNFKAMPELDWAWGYPMALAIIVLSALIPLAWFKARHWF